MRFHSRQTRRAPARTLLAAVALTLTVAAGCSSDKTTAPATATTPRTYDQVQRLGNPLVSEVFLFKKDHPFHGSIGPSGDVAAFSDELKGFVAAFRPNATTLQTTLASVLLPDMLVIQTNMDPGTAGWLSWALSNGWGGRKLTDDVVDVGLTAIFSTLLDSTQAVCAPFQLPLCTDNIGSHATFTATFPYLGVPK
jgi:hypothetical protein